ncbi:sn-glycerol-3-phosphate import ATP-binding protein UgpC [mine drainage metagenome]|uniref:sn-glycerol-3-phosphate import ATP-binding protein UgpC n=1 Tax=mine drainage metagenome TaxID=410659 RepID=A0A1J5PWU2_9ZZZZ
MAFLEISNLQKHFGNHAAVKDFSIGVDKGEFITFLGPSGCGKTTILRMLAGFEAPSHGRIVFDGKEVTALRTSQRNVGMVFQSYALFPNMTVAENIGFGLKVAHMPAAQMQARVKEMLDLIGLDTLAGRYPWQMSGGQQQRVALARAIANKPKVLLLDEPLSALDAKIRVSLREEIRALQRELNITTVFVTHDQVEAMTLAQRVVVMNQGRIEQVGTPGEVYARPSSVFVAGFLGAPGMNLFDAELGEDRQTVTVAGGGALRLPRALAGAGGRKLALGVRPEALAPSAQGEWAFDIVLREALGAETIVHGQIGGQACVVRMPGDADWHEGQRIAVTAPPAALHVFDRESGARIGE